MGSKRDMTGILRTVIRIQTKNRLQKAGSDWVIIEDQEEEEKVLSVKVQISGSIAEIKSMHFQDGSKVPNCYRTACKKQIGERLAPQISEWKTRRAQRGF